MPKVSVIIPVYNVEKYLSRCLDSVTNQTLKDIEIICINDDSTDDSLKILKKYASKDNRIKIIDLPQNNGAGNARNAGIKTASGEYLGFVDPDDDIDLNYFEKLYDKAVETDADIVKCKRIIYDDDKTIVSIMNENIKNKSKFYFSHEWTTAIYRRDIIFKNQITVPDISVSEDVVFLNRVLLKSKKVEVIDDVKYYYYRRPDSLNSCCYEAGKINDALKAIEYILSDYNDAFESKDITKDEYIKQYYKYLNIIPNYILKKTGIKELHQICAQKYIQLFYLCRMQDVLYELLNSRNKSITECIKSGNFNELSDVFTQNKGQRELLINRLRQNVRKDFAK